MAREVSALDLDRLLCDMPPMPPEVAKALHALIPTAYRDQLVAAREELLARAEAGVGKPHLEVPARDVPDWFRLGLLDTFATWTMGKGRTCRHNPTYKAPQPVYSAAWMPRAVFCGECVVSGVRQGVSAVADRTCDCCGHVCTLEGEDMIYTFGAVLGALSYMAGACRDCVKDIPQ